MTRQKLMNSFQPYTAGHDEPPSQGGVCLELVQAKVQSLDPIHPMKLFRVLLATGSTLVALSSLKAVDSNSQLSRPAWQWVTSYYQNPRPDDLLPAVHSLSRSGYFESVGQPAVAIGFFTTVFAQNPQH